MLKKASVLPECMRDFILTQLPQQLASNFSFTTDTCVTPFTKNAMLPAGEWLPPSLGVFKNLKKRFKCCVHWRGG